MPRPAVADRAQELAELAAELRDVVRRVEFLEVQLRAVGAICKTQDSRASC